MPDAGGPPKPDDPFRQSIKSEHGLGPHVVGQRVVVRRVLRGETGPTGGPAFTDVLGVCESWADGVAGIRTADGALVLIATGDIVSGKPVPPRPSRFSRISAEEVERRAADLFQPRETERIGDWLLRFDGGTRARPNSLLPVGDPGTDLDDALARTVAFYTARDRPACAQVVVGSGVQEALQARGWQVLRPGEADTEVQLAGVSAVRRRLADVPTDDVLHEEAPDLPRTSYARVRDERGAELAGGRIVLVDDWALLADLAVRSDVRRQGLGRRIMAGLTEWAAERGASVLLLQVVGDSEPARRFYADLGFEVHHRYRHLRAPGD